MKKLLQFLYILLFFPAIAYADIASLPWSTTFNCSETTVTYASCSANNYLNVCDGFETAICYSLQSGISAAHNFPGGGGGNGLFVQYGDGNTLSSVGPQGTGYQIDFSTPQTNFWLRWHFKFQNDMPCSSNAGFDYHKLLYIYPSSGQAAYWDDVPGAYVGGSGFRLYNQQVSQSYFVPSQVFNFEDFYDSSIADGTWHSIEVHINTSTGVFEFWAYKDNVDNATPIASFTTSWPAAIDIIKIPENAKTDFTGARNGVVYTISYDDIAISTTGRIGPISGGGDLTAPTVAITTIDGSSNTSATYSTSSSTVTLAGMSSDAVGVTQVQIEWTEGGSPRAEICTGTTAWTAPTIALYSGVTVFTVRAYDAANNQGTDTLTVTYTPVVEAPTVTSISVNGSIATINFSETVVTTGYDTGDFNLDCTSPTLTDVALSSPSGTGASRTFTIATPIVYGQVCNLDYVGSTNDIEDSEGNDMIAFSNMAVTNNTSQASGPVEHSASDVRGVVLRGVRK